MKKLVPALVAAAVALVVALAALVVASPFGTDADGELAAAAARGAADDPDEETDDPGPPSAKAKERNGDGPPPWAHGRGGPDHGAHKQAHRDWQKRWREMTPQQRERTMTRLAEEHAAGMRAWARCRADGRDDCEKPTPPGIAKKQ